VSALFAVRAEARRFSLDALEDYIGSPNAPETAERLGVDPKQVDCWREYGLTEYQADHLAIYAGTHPGDVWPEWYDIEVDADDGPEATASWHEYTKHWPAEARRQHLRAHLERRATG
jgi:hypothetical protein